jgi:hypothetical protein
MHAFSIFLRMLCALCGATGFAFGGVSLDLDSLGSSLGGWQKRDTIAEYDLSGSTYRTYRPEVSPTPDGGIFVSIRIDHVRGWLASNDHAVLEITISKAGAITSAKSSIAIQGRSITSDLIRATTAAGQELTTADRSVQIGTDLVADLSAKLLRERIVESGRVTFPAALRHNYNLLFQAIRVAKVEEAGAEGAKPEENPPAAAGLNIQPYATPKDVELAPEKKE